MVVRLSRAAWWWRRLGPPCALGVGLAGLALTASACGGPSATPGVASIGTPTTLAAAASAGATGGPSGQPGARALKFAACMRSHGVPQFPNPVISQQGRSVSIRIAVGTPGASKNSPQFQKALGSCGYLLPSGPPKGPTIPPKDQVDYLKAAQCMRSHGIVGFPDPIFRNGGVQFVIPSSMDSNSTPFRKARLICEKLIPAGLPYSS